MRHDTLISIAAAGFLLQLLLCAIPENPDNPDNAAGMLQLYSPVSGLSDSLVIDSVGSVIDISVSYKLSQYIDSIMIEILSDNSAPMNQNTDTLITLEFASDNPPEKQTFKITLTSAGTKTVTLTTFKSNGSISMNHATIIVYARETDTNSPPVFKADSPSVLYFLDRGELLDIPVAADDPDNDALTYQFFFKEPVLPRPSTATLESGRFTWQSHTEDEGAFQVVFKAFDGISSTIIQVTVVVDDTSENIAPKITSIPTLVAAEGEKWQYTPVAVAFRETVFTWSLTGKNASLMDFDPQTGALSWTPASGTRSSDSLTLKVIDGNEPPLSDSQSFVITVIAVNDTPYAIGQVLNIDGTQPIVMTLSAYDKTDSLFSFAVTGFTSNGEIDTAHLPVITYTPAGDFSGADTITFTATDQSGLTSKPARIVINVSNETTAPVAVPLSLTMNEDDSLVITLEGTDSRTASGDLVYSITGTVTIGSLSEIDENKLTYTPPDDFFGADSFFYRVFNGEQFSDTAGVLITVEAVNDTPTTSGQALSTDLNTPLTFTLKGSDAEDSVLTFQIINGPASGSLDTGALPTIIYTPSDDFKGVDSLHYRVIDPEGLQSPAGLVTIAVASDNQKPTAASLSVTISEDHDTAITLAGSDIETPASELTYSIYSEAAHGTLGEISEDQVTYTPDPDFSGPDTFYYIVNDGTLDSDSGRVVIRVTAVNDNPVSTVDIYTTDEDQVLTVNSSDGVLANDSDPEDDDLTAEIVDPVPSEKGSVVLDPDGSFVFTPAANVNGTVRFTYHAVDDKGGTGETDTVTIIISALNDPSEISGLSSISVEEGDSVTREIVATDPDEIPSLSITDGEQQWIQAAQVSEDRIRITVSPDHDVVQSGTQATYTLHFRATEDGQHTEDSLRITVVNVNQQPTVNLDRAGTTDTVAAGAALSLTVTADDPDGTVSEVILYHNGTPQSDNTSPYQFSIPALAYGNHTFRAVAVDNGNDSASTVEYTVKAGRWKGRSFSGTGSYSYKFDYDGIPVNSSLSKYSDELVINIARYNPVSETWASTGALVIDSSIVNSYQSDENSISYRFAFSPDNLPVVLLDFVKSNYDQDDNLISYDQTYLLYTQSSSGTWSRVGPTLAKTTLSPIHGYSAENLTISSNGIITYCLTETEMRSTLSSTSYTVNGNSLDSVSNPVTYTDITYLGTTLYSHCGSFIYENPVKVHYLSGTSWSPIGDFDGTVTASYQQHNRLTQGSDGTLYISVPDKGVFTYDNSGTWLETWPIDDVDTSAINISVNAIGNTPFVIYTQPTEDNSEYNLYCKKIRNGSADGILEESGLISTFPTSISNISHFSEQGMIMFREGMDIWHIYQLDIP